MNPAAPVTTMVSLINSSRLRAQAPHPDTQELAEIADRSPNRVVAGVAVVGPFHRELGQFHSQLARDDQRLDVEHETVGLDPRENLLSRVPRVNFETALGIR